MTNPIINHYGEVVSFTRGFEYDFWTVNSEGTEAVLAPEGEAYNFHIAVYATREAAEMALIRAKCIQRLSVMAYANGFSDDYSHKIYIHPLNDEGQKQKSQRLELPVYFKNSESRHQAVKTITPEERAAFLFVHKEGE